MKPEIFAQQILFGEKLDDKIINPLIGDFDFYPGGSLPDSPFREKKITFSEKRAKFPKAHLFHLPEKRGMALHYFANHELLAIEMMAAFLVKFPTKDESDKKLKRGILNALFDEQKHLALYLERMNELGIGFGDFPLNDFFWKQMLKINNPEQFLGVMSLTFESANLDFSLFYKKVFFNVEDFKSAELMDIIFEDEVSHVKLGHFWLNKWRMDKDMFDYYQSILPKDFTPSRAIGIGYQRWTREKVGFDKTFIEKLENYKDTAPFLNRKINVL
jgi:uncharacterized ferritin-like protein (DUF455 family)